jgi:transposase
MGRSHTWVLRGQELVDPRPRNWGDNLTMIGALRLKSWVAMGTGWRAVTRARFVDWVRRRLVPKLRRGDVAVLDNLTAHKDPRVETLLSDCGAMLHPLPPYGDDLNPIEPAWGLIKKRIRASAPRSGRALRRTPQHAWHAIRPRHCRNWFAHAGYRQLE